MKPITKQHNQNAYMFLMGLALFFCIMFIWKQEAHYLLGALILIGLGVFRKYWLGKRLKT